MKKLFARGLAALLSLMILFGAAACGNTEKKPDPTPSSSAPVSSAAAKDIGQGDTAFTLEVVDSEGARSLFNVKTNEKTVGAALLALDLIAGEDSQYGLYVKTVNGITADYDTDGSYWAFYIDGEYAQTGVDSTDIKAGATYTLKVEVAEG